MDTNPLGIANQDENNCTLVVLSTIRAILGYNTPLQDFMVELFRKYKVENGLLIGDLLELVSESLADYDVEVWCSDDNAEIVPHFDNLIYKGDNLIGDNDMFFDRLVFFSYYVPSDDGDNQAVAHFVIGTPRVYDPMKVISVFAVVL